MPAKPEFGAGCMTKRIATRRIAGAQTSARESFEPVQAQGQPAETGVFATIEYEDNGGRKQFKVTKDEIVVGRGGRDYWTDLKLDTLPDVSREHFRLRRDPATNTFYLKDLSRLGTTVNGEKAPSSIEFTEGEKHDRNVEVPLPATARIGLANVIFLEFRSGANG
jgi:pSer/pThr/pTyr-binding forkhead associated (FHA) protein